MALSPSAHTNLIIFAKTSSFLSIRAGLKAIEKAGTAQGVLSKQSGLVRYPDV